MAKLTLTDIAAGYLSIATYNANNVLLEAALENTLSRDGTSPNTMSVAIDMNSNLINNVTDGVNAQDAATKAQLDAVVAGVEITVADLTNVGDGTPTNLFVLVGDGDSFESRALVEADISDLGAYLTAVQAGDVDAEASTDGHVLTSDGAGNAAWEVVPGGGVAELVDLSDVASTTKTTRFALMANGTNFVSRAVVEADISDLQTYLTSETFTSVLQDTSPQLGGDLDTNGNDITGAGLVNQSNLSASECGFKGAPQRIVNTSDTLVLADTGKQIYKASGGAGETITIPANGSVAFPIGTIIIIINDGGGDLSIAITTDTLEKYAGSTGTQTLGDNNKAVIEKVTATLWKYASTD